MECLSAKSVHHIVILGITSVVKKILKDIDKNYKLGTIAIGTPCSLHKEKRPVTYFGTEMILATGEDIDEGKKLAITLYMIINKHVYLMINLDT